LSDVIVYVDHSRVRPGKRAELDRGIEGLVAFVDRHQPQLLTYGFYFAGDEMAVVGVHPDASSLERHLEVGAPEFAKLAHLIDLRSIEVYGEPTPAVLALLRAKAEMLGDAGSVVVKHRQAGFSRVG
jgi:hypothetical protein